ARGDAGGARGHRPSGRNRRSRSRRRRRRAGRARDRPDGGRRRRNDSIVAAARRPDSHQSDGQPDRRRANMAYVKPDAVMEQMIQVGAGKARLPIRDLLTRGFLSGALLGFATTLALTASLQTKIGLVGALVFPVGFVMIVLLGLELVTGNFALVPLAVHEQRASVTGLLANWGCVFVG